MGEKTNIEWAEATWNPWVGCTKVSDGCKNCYMFRQQTQYGNDPTVVRRTSDTTFYAPLRSKKWQDPKTIFVCSWSDFFHEAADGWRDDAWAVIRQAKQHTYLILTKRPENMPSRMPFDWGYPEWDHVWLGVTVEDKAYRERLNRMLEVPARHYFVSCEPLLGSVDLDPWLRDGHLDWVIVGGESGPHYRVMLNSHAGLIVEQCVAYDVPVFLKQLGGWPDKQGGDKARIYGNLWHQKPRFGSVSV